MKLRSHVSDGSRISRTRAAALSDAAYAADRQGPYLNRDHRIFMKDAVFRERAS
jgi:hypothetical protein